MSLLSVRVKPKSSRREIVECRNGVWQVALTSPPEGGKANRELLKILSESLGVPSSALEIVRGFRSREKVVSVSGLDEETIDQILLERVGGSR